MRIYYLNTTIGYNAGGRLVQMLAGKAAAAGHTVRVAFDRGEPPRDIPAFRPGSMLSRVSHALRTRMTDAHGHGSVRATQALIADMRRFGPDVVHLHNLHGYWLNMPRFMEWLAESGVKVIWTLHDFWPFTGHCAFPQQAGCRLWFTGCRDCPATGEYPASWGHDRSVANYQERRNWLAALPQVTYVAVSQWQKSELESAMGDGFRCEVIHNPVDTSIFRQSDVTRSSHVVLGAASVWDARKGLDRFVSLRRELPSDYTIVLAGLTPRQIKSLPAGIEGRPRISDSRDMAAFMSSGAVFVNLSQAETLGMVNVEARACGTPVVSLASGGMSETVTPASGFLLDGFDARLTAARIVEAAAPGRFNHAALALEAAEEFAPHRLAGEYLAMYTE